MVMIKDDRPVEIGVSEMLCFLTDRLRGIIRAELELELGSSQDKKHWLDLERIFIENRIYKRIEDATTAEQVVYEVRVGLEPFLAELDREVTDDDIERLLKIPIRRISQYDIDKNRNDIAATIKAIKKVRGKLRKLTETTIEWIEEILAKYGDRWPRRTEITSFETVNVRAVARQNLKLAYDTETGFFGTAVKGDRFQLTVSEYDKILLISRDGTYRVVSPEEKIFVPGKVIWAGVLDPDEGREVHRRLPHVGQDDLWQEDPHQGLHQGPRVPAHQGPQRPGRSPHRGRLGRSRPHGLRPRQETAGARGRVRSRRTRVQGSGRPRPPPRAETGGQAQEVQARRHAAAGTGRSPKHPIPTSSRCSSRTRVAIAVSC